MKTEYIMEAIAEALEKIIVGEWHHEGYVVDAGRCSADLRIDGVTYSIYICRVPAINTDGDGNVIGHGKQEVGA